MTSRLFLADTVGKTIFSWFLVVCVIGSVAALFIGFVPVQPLVFAASSLSAAITAYFIWLWLRLLRSRPEVFPRDRGVKYVSLVAVGFCAVAGMWFLLFLVTVPALFTELLGAPYIADDRVLQTNVCSGRRCAFCSHEVRLEHHHPIFDRVCLNNEQGAPLRPGALVRLVGRSSFFGVRVERLEANPPLQGTPEKLRFSVPSALRAPVAPELAR